LTHTLSPTSFFTLEFNYNYTDNQLRANASDANQSKNWIFVPVDSSYYIGADSIFSPSIFSAYADSVFYDYLERYPEGFNPDSIDKSLIYATYWYSTGSPNGASGRFYDPQLTQFVLYSHTPAVDSSFSAVYQLKGDYTNEINQFHKIETGFDVRYHDIFVYSGDGWSASSFPPSRFQYYRVHPAEVGLYFQDVLTFKGFISTVGIRADYFHPIRDGYEVGHPLDEGYRELTRYYDQLPGDLDSYERWTAYREVLNDPPGWPRKKSAGTFLLSPRLGASFPISVSSKMYFNYGHFYQRAPISFLYNMTNYGQIPTPGLDFEKTVSFEFGYEQSFLDNYLYNVSFYYKDVQNRPLEKTYINYYEDLQISTYAPDGYRDIRGIEMRLEKNIGRFFTFWANYDYQVFSSGQTGLSNIYENQLKADLQERETNEQNPQARPTINTSLAFHTPRNWGPRLLGSRFLGGLFANFLIEWREGGYFVFNPNEPNPDKQLRVDVVDYFNLDFRATKSLLRGKVDLVLTVKNLLDIKRLTVNNLVFGQREAYKESLHLPFKEDTLKGNDKWGEFDMPLPDDANWLEEQIHKLLYGSWGDNSHIDTGWWEAPIFLNPRRIILGIRFKL
ncbi:MAG: hypothetical protein ACETWG_03090, partial [Candidatus Neomarinimicrobiota bacterium]